MSLRFYDSNVEFAFGNMHPLPQLPKGCLAESDSLNLAFACR